LAGNGIARWCNLTHTTYPAMGGKIGDCTLNRHKTFKGRHLRIATSPGSMPSLFNH